MQSDMKLYKELARFYDLIYSQTFKEFHEKYAFFIFEAYKKFCKSKGKNLLEVACGTGELMKRLKKFGFNVAGLDLNKEMIKIAKKKLKAKFYIADMKSFSLDEKFDVIACVFTSMNYNLNKTELENTLKNFYEHLKQGGIVVFDIPPKRFLEKRIGKQWINVFEHGALKIVRISQLEKGAEENTVKNVMAYFFKEKGKIDFEIDVHVQGLFSVAEVKKLMKKVGFKKVYVFGNMNFEKYTINSNRAYFVG